MTHDNEPPRHSKDVARRYSLRCPDAWPGSSSATSTGTTGNLVHGVADWVDRRVDPDAGAPRWWVVGSLAWVFQEDKWKVSVALATVLGERRASTKKIDGEAWIFPARGRSR